MKSIQWLHDLFGPYDFYYLDPIILKDSKSTEPSRKHNQTFWQWLQNKPTVEAWFKSDTQQIDDLFHKLRQIIGIKDGVYDLDQFFEDGIHSNLLNDRNMQRQFTDAILKLLSVPNNPDPKKKNQTPSIKPLGAKRKFDTVKKLREEGKHLGDLPNSSTASNIIIADGMIVRVDTDTHADLYSLVNVTPQTQDRHTRLVRFMITDTAWPLMWLDVPCIGLMVDQKALTKTYLDGSSSTGHIDIVGLEDWYPFAKVFGYWRTDRGGRPYIDVLAILIRTFPTMDEILRPRAMGPKTKLMQMLEDGITNAQKEYNTVQNKQPYVLQNDATLLYPLLLTRLLFGLNGINMTHLQARAPMYYSKFHEYYRTLDKLARVLKAKHFESLLPAFIEKQEQLPVPILGIKPQDGL